MSFFIVGKSDSKDFQKRIEGIFDDLKFAGENRKLNVCTVGSFALCQSPSKVIDDIFIQSDNSDSWLLLVGAPVIEANTDAEKQNFANEFFHDPGRVLRYQIDGHYALLAFDAEKQVFFAGSDWNSLIPIYFAMTREREGPLFSNAELSLATLLQPQPDEFGFAQSIHYGAVWGDRTRFSGIHKLETCELVRIDAGNSVKRERYWEPAMEEQWRGSFGDISQRWLEVMRNAIRVFSDRRNGSEVSSDLTGGEDSRLVAAILYSLDIPFRVRVAGEPNDLDVEIARKAAASIGIDLSIENTCPAEIDELSEHAEMIITHSDAYGSFFTNASGFIHESHHRPLEFKNVHFCGLPGGAQFRGANYLRAKLLRPSSYKTLDSQTYTRRKYLSDFSYNLLKMPDSDYFEGVYGVMKSALADVEGFPSGIQVDHLGRVRYGCLLTAHIKRPFYFAFAPRDMTRSTYNIPPHMKKGGQQYKSIIETLAPELAWVKSQVGVPTVRKTFLRQPLFFPEYYALLKRIVKWLARQKFKKAAALRSKGNVNARHHTLAFHENTLGWLFGTEPYSSWFKSADSMLTGDQYNASGLNELLLKARQPGFDQVQLFGRIVNQEMAHRRIYHSRDS
jgi:hypothetical protein